MKRFGTRIGLFVLTVVSLSAGVVAGLLAARVPASAAQVETSSAAVEQTPLVQELQLTPEQRDQIRPIWEDIRRRVHQTFADAQNLQKQRDDVLIALLNDEQKARFEKISHEYARRFEELSRKRDEMFETAVEQTKTLLNESQRRKYEQIIRTQVKRETPNLLAPPKSTVIQAPPGGPTS